MDRIELEAIALICDELDKTALVLEELSSNIEKQLEIIKNNG